MRPRPSPGEKAQVPLSFQTWEAVIEKRRSSAKRVHQIASSLNSKETMSCIAASIVAQAISKHQRLSDR